MFVLQYTEAKSDVEKCQYVVLQNCKTCLQQPEMFTGQSIPEQFVDLFVESRDLLGLYIGRIECGRVLSAIG